MPGPRARLLVSGDFHLGRYPSRVPPSDPSLAIEAVVRSLVDQAIERSVDAVVLTGDVADESNKYFEAYGVLERTLHRLVDAGIPRRGRRGQPRLRRARLRRRRRRAGHHGPGPGPDLGGGAAGRSGGREAVRFVGWSYAGPHVHASPMASWPGVRGDVPVIGIAPRRPRRGGQLLRPRHLRRPPGVRGVGVAAGPRPHRPRRVRPIGRRAVGALPPGSPQPLDPGEPGPHGAWLVEVADDGGVRAEAVPLATVRYDRLAVDLAETTDETEVRERIAVALREHGAALRRSSPALRRAVVRLVLTGRTRAFRAVGAVVDELEAGGETTAGGLTVTIDRVVTTARDRRWTWRGWRPAAAPSPRWRRWPHRLETGEPSDGDLRLIRDGRRDAAAGLGARACSSPWRATAAWTPTSRPRPSAACTARPTGCSTRRWPRSPSDHAVPDDPAPDGAAPDDVRTSGGALASAAPTSTGDSAPADPPATPASAPPSDG